MLCLEGKGWQGCGEGKFGDFFIFFWRIFVFVKWPNKLDLRGLKQNAEDWSAGRGVVSEFRSAGLGRLGDLWSWDTYLGYLGVEE